jgi:hypothetical protein
MCQEFISIPSSVALVLWCRSGLRFLPTTAQSRFLLSPRLHFFHVLIRVLFELPRSDLDFSREFLLERGRRFPPVPICAPVRPWLGRVAQCEGFARVQHSLSPVPLLGVCRSFCRLVQQSRWCPDSRVRTGISFRSDPRRCSHQSRALCCFCVCLQSRFIFAYKILSTVIGLSFLGLCEVLFHNLDWRLAD